MGLEVFYSSPQNEVYKDLPIPFSFTDVFGYFLELYALSGQDGITWQSIESYCHVRDITLSQFEIDYILKIRSWVEDETAKMRDELTETNDKEVD